MLSELKFGLFLPPFHDLADAQRVVQLAVVAEGAGWDGLFLWDHMLAGAGTPIADPWVTMTAIACATGKLRFGALVTPLSRRRPWVLARQISTLDRLSQGRLVVGVGLGDDGWSEFSSFGEITEPQQRGRILDDSLTILQLLLRGEPVAHSGRTMRVDATPFLPLPRQNPVPIWAAGRWPRRRPLERASRVQGFFPIFLRSDLEQAPPQADLLEIRRELTSRGVSPSFDLVVTWKLSAPEAKPGMDATLARMDEAGVTWALESFSPEPVPPAAIERIVKAGPPRRRSDG